MDEIKFIHMDGISVGHAEDMEGATGCSVVICKDGATAGVDVRGGAPGTRETDLGAAAIGAAPLHDRIGIWGVGGASGPAVPRGQDHAVSQICHGRDAIEEVAGGPVCRQVHFRKSPGSCGGAVRRDGGGLGCGNGSGQQGEG